MIKHTKRIMDEELKKKLRKMHYGIVGEDSAVQICHWTKKELKGEEGCWKKKFYGISSAGCCQMTPNVMKCDNSCIHCWRPIEYNKGVKKEQEPIKPEELIKGVIEERKRLLNGFLGNRKVNKKDYEMATEPSLFTTSLSGEPTLYPYLGEFFNLVRKRKAVSFLVTNGQNPEAIKELEKKGLPTQITLSTNAPNKELFVKWHRSCHSDSWERFQDTLKILNKLEGKVRRVIRLTLVKKGDEGEEGLRDISNMREEHIKEYTDIIRKADPDFVHIKGFKSVGYARDRLGYTRQPWFDEVKEYARKIKKELKEDYEIKGEDEPSGVILLAKKDKEIKITKV